MADAKLTLDVTIEIFSVRDATGEDPMQIASGTPGSPCRVFSNHLWHKRTRTRLSFA